MFGAPKPTGFGAAFGAGTTFGSTTPFGAATPSTSTAFGTTPFGAQTPASGGLFGTTAPTSTGGLFGQPASTFGQTSGFTFGATPTTTVSLFGQATQASSVFSTPNTFGTTSALGGGFGGTTTGGLFGSQNTTATSTGGASIFGSSALFGSSNVPTGTTVKFTPVTGNDQMVKNGLNTQISTKHQCITAMKEYEQKSLEELRVDDYGANRKGKQQATLFGAQPAGTSTGFGSFGQPAAATTFGSTTGFGAVSSAPSLFGQTPASTSTLFGQTKPLFGTATTTTAAPSFGFGATSTPSLFGQTAANKSLFGTATSTPASGGLFGTTTPAFGGTTGFSFNTSTAPVTTQQQPSGGLFGAAKPAFGTSTAPSIFGNAASTGTSLFNKPATSGGFSFGAATSTPAFGATTGGSLFGAKPTGFGTTSSTLGAGTFGALGSGFGNTGAGASSLFGNAAAKPGFSFGNTGSTFGGLGGATNTATTFSFGNQTTSALGGNADLLVAAQQAQVQQQLAALTHSPYGDSPLFMNLKNTSTNREDILKPTNPAAQKAALNQYKVSPRPANKIKPKLLTPVFNGNKSSVFDGVEEEDFCFGNSKFVPRKSIKKLVIRSKSPNGSGRQSLNGSGWQSSLNQDDSVVVNGYGTDAATPSSGVTNGYGNNNATPNYNVHGEQNEPPNDSLLRPLTPPPQTPTISQQQHREQQLDDTMAYINPPANHVTSQNASLNESQASQDLDQSELQPIQDLPPHPTGIIMSRPGYYTVPALDELTNMMDANGNIFVENFTIGRYNYGSMWFPGETNVAHLNIDAIVHFRRKEVIVYPDDENKPPLGEGLNKPAEVTLDCVWPTDKTNKTPIKSPERLQLMNYRDKIEISTAKIGARFMDYRPETGSWVFKVKHFSKYGLDDSDDEEMTEAEIKKSRLQQQLLIQKQGMPQIPPNPLLQQQPTTQQLPATDTNQSALLFQSQGQPLPTTMPYLSQSDQTVPSSMDLIGEDAEDKDDGEPMTDDDDDVITGLIEEEMGDYDGISGEESSPEKVFEEMEPSSHRLATGLGLDPRNVQTMKASLFEDDVIPMPTHEPISLRTSQSDTTMSPVSQRGDPSRPSLFTNALRQKYNTSMSTIRRSSSTTDTHKDTSSYTHKDTSILREPCKITKSHQPSTDHLIVPNGLLHEKSHSLRAFGIKTTHSIPPLQKSSTYHNQHLIHDAGMFMGRRFRVGWGPGNTLIHSGDSIGQIPGSEGTKNYSILSGKSTSEPLSKGPWRVTMERVNVTPYMEYERDALKTHHTALLHTQLKHSVTSETTTDQCPLYTPSTGVKALHDLCATADKLKEGEECGDSATLEHMRMVWHLCVALWGNIPHFQHDDDTSDRIYAHQQARREAFSDWLTMVSCDRVKREVKLANSQGSSYLCAILSLLSGGCIVEACTLAQKQSDHRLALLLAQAAGSDYTRQVLAKQIMNWAEINADEYITADRLKIFSLLASHMVWVASDKTVNCCETMDWKRALALHLWYMCKSTGTITEALSEYDSAYGGDNPHGKYSLPPLPPYIEQTHEDLTFDGHGKKADIFLKDTCYHLLKLYTVRSYSLERVLCPVTSTANQLDYRMSWHLCQVLFSLGSTHLSEQRLCLIHTSYASQLECLGLWHWAVYVLMHIEDNVRRKKAVTDVLNRHITLSQDTAYREKEDFVQEKLGVPAPWVHYAKALRAKHTGDTEKEAWHLVRACDWSAGHRVIVKHIAADAVINEDLDYLKSYLDELSPPDRSCSIKNWISGGSVYLNYIHLIESLDSIQQGEPSMYELERLEPQVVSLCSRVGSLKCYTPKHRLCQLEMSKKSANLLRTLISLQQQTPPEHVPVSLLAPHISNLPMSEDYSMQELRALTSTAMIQLAS